MGVTLVELKDYKRLIKQRMGEKRFNHSLCVSEEAKRLANLYGADEEKAALAGILHDITKETPKETQLQIISDSGIILENTEINSPSLWHAISGCAFIKNELLIDDEDILNAVRFHTTGRENMSLLEKIIFTADFTSRDRKYDDVEVIRKKANKSLEQAMLYGISYTIADLSKKQSVIHLDTVRAYNELVISQNNK